MKTIIFDLDGTLLPIDQDSFIRAYFQLIAQRLAKKGVDPKGLLAAIMEGTTAMLKNDGQMTNEKAFWIRFNQVHKGPLLDYAKEFEAFYIEEFDQLKAGIKPHPQAPDLIRKLRKKGYSLVLATNPLFPLIAITKRIQWAGLDPKDFSYITSLENSSFSKPHPKYYLSLLEKLKLEFQDIVAIVGNDPVDDMFLTSQGVPGVIVDDFLIAPKTSVTYTYLQMKFKELLSYFEAIKS